MKTSIACLSIALTSLLACSTVSPAESTGTATGAATGVGVSRCFLFDVYAKEHVSYSYSDFEGAVGAGGNIQLSHFSVNARGSDADVAIAAGGAVSFQHGTVNGAIEAGGDVTISNHDAWSVSAGGYCGASNGWNLSCRSFTAPRFGAAEHAAIQASLESIGAKLLAYPAQAVTADASGTLRFATTNIANVSLFTVAGADLAAAIRVEIDAPPQAVVVVNVTGSGNVGHPTGDTFVLARDPAKTASPAGSYTTYAGIAPTRILFNFVDATYLDFTNTVLFGTVLAPKAHVTFRSGRLEGGLYARSLDGQSPGGQINLEPFVALGSLCASQALSP